MPRRQSITTVFHVPETGYFGYAFQFAGQRPHSRMAWCKTFQDALDACDPHREHVWEEPSDADETVLLISRGCKEGSVGWRMENPSPVAEPSK